jgi:hypothetical protein
VKYLDQKRKAAQYHRDLTSVNIARGLELAQRQRGKLVLPAEYDELEATALLAVYMVQLHVTGLIDNEDVQRRVIERARKIAEAKIKESGRPDELTVEVF